MIGIGFCEWLYWRWDGQMTMKVSISDHYYYCGHRSANQHLGGLLYLNTAPGWDTSHGMLHLAIVVVRYTWSLSVVGWPVRHFAAITVQSVTSHRTEGIGYCSVSATPGRLVTCDPLAVVVNTLPLSCKHQMDYFNNCVLIWSILLRSRLETPT